MCFLSRFGKIKTSKKLTHFIGTWRMNLHEQCLLRYLQNPDELSYSTQILKLNNDILEKQFVLRNIIAKSNSFNYTEIVK